LNVPVQSGFIKVAPKHQTLDVLAVSGHYWFAELRGCVLSEVGAEAEGTGEHRPPSTADGTCPDTCGGL